jgi:hypothetical protein
VPDPVHAVVVGGAVTDLTLMDAATAEQWRAAGFVDQMWPGADLVDVTDADPRPSPGWAYDGAAFTPPDPGPQPDEQETSTP